MSRRAVVYCRISRDRAGAGLGVERQEVDCRALADRLGWSVVAVHSDNDLSAYSGKPRPGYRALLADVRGGHADAVVAWHLDRLHRSPVELEDYIAACTDNGRDVPTHCVQAGPLDLATATGRMQARISGAVARHEVDHMIERQRSAKAQAAAAGKYRGGRRPFGYEADGITVRPAEARTVAEVTRRVLVGESLRSITTDLNSRGSTTSAGGPWTYTTLRRTILRARNAGLIEHDGQEAGEACWPAIVEPDMWRAVRSLLRDPSRKIPYSREYRFLGSGVFVCGVCGQTMLTATTQGAGNRRHPSYRCRGGPHLTRMAEPVDELVTEVVIARLSRADARLLLHDTSRPDVPAMQERSEVLRGRLDELSALFAVGEVDGRQLATGTVNIRAQLDQVEAALASAAAGTPLAGFADAEDVAHAWGTASVSRRKAVIRALMTVTLLKAPRGRRPGGGYFDLMSVEITPREVT